MVAFRRPYYRAVIIVHVVASVAWLGLSLCLVVLGVTAATTADAGVQFATGTAAAALVGTLAVPLGATALVSGLALSFGTRWSLRYRWVAVKLAGTAIAFALTVFALRPGLAATAATLDPAQVRVVDDQMWAAPIVASCVYLSATVLSYVKPWGRMRAFASPAPVRSGR